MRGKCILWLLLLLGLIDFHVDTGISVFVSEANAITRSSRNKKTSASTGRNSKKRQTSKRRKGRGALITTVYSNPETGEWIHRGKRNIVVHRDSTDKLRAMVPFSMNPHIAKPYADIINRYCHELGTRNIRIHSLVAPTQGEYYMPEQIKDNLSQQEAIMEWGKYLDPNVSQILVCDTLRAHIEEEIYLRTDHHWSALGAYYAGAKIAENLGASSFVSLEDCKPDTVHNFVGTMVNFSGDTKILSYPEDFVYYVTPGENEAQFIDYTLKSNKVASRETLPHRDKLFRKFHDGSRSAYSTFLGGDNHTVKAENPQALSCRKVLLVKDSYGNALLPYLVPSFAEVHAIDFRHFPHSLTDYILDNDITDVIFVNCIELAFTASTTARLNELIKSTKR